MNSTATNGGNNRRANPKSSLLNDYGNYHKSLAVAVAVLFLCGCSMPKMNVKNPKTPVQVHPQVYLHIEVKPEGPIYVPVDAKDFIEAGGNSVAIPAGAMGAIGELLKP